jgi:hypothetical protein
VAACTCRHDGACTSADVPRCFAAAQLCRVLLGDRLHWPGPAVGGLFERCLQPETVLLGRWSPNCSAFWGRFVRDDCSTLNSHGFWLKIHRDAQTPYGWSPAESYYKDIPSAWYSGFNCDSIRWTKMIGWQVGSRYKTCRYRYYDSRPDPAALPDSAWECLDWFVVPAP